MKKISLSGLFIFIALNFSFAQEIPVSVPEGLHPRLLFTEKTLKTVKKNLSHAENEAAVREMDLLLFEYHGRNIRFERSGKKSYFWSGKTLAAIEASAFKYALSGEKEYAQWAYSAFINCCDSINLSGIYDDYRPYGQMMLTAAEIYDWCFNVLTKKEREELYKRTLFFAKKLQIGYPPVKGKAVTGHSAECQLLRAYLAAGIAMHDEHEDLWQMSAQRFYREFVPSRKFFCESGAPNFQGSGYGPYRSIFDLWSSLLITGMGGEEPYGGSLKKWSRYFIYLIRPDGMCWHLGDDHSIEKMSFNNFRYGSNAFLQSAVSKDPYAKSFAYEMLSPGGQLKFKYNENGENDELLTPVQFLIFNDVNVKKEDYRELKSAYYCPSPLGEYFALSSMEKDSKGTALHLKIGEITQANHEHQDAGSFELYCNGLLASTAGFYISGGGYRSDHTQKFYHASVSKNTLLLQTDEKTYEGYGLQQTIQEAKSFEQILTDKNYHRAEVRAHYDNLKEGKGIVFLSGDISAAYKDKGSLHRSMLAYFTGNKDKPLLFFVYDEALTEGRAVFLLNTLSEPQVKGNTVDVINKKSGGFLKNTVLLPVDSRIIKRGGKGHEWEVAGVNYSEGSEKSVTEKSESGWGRLEISSGDFKGSKDRAEKQILLNVMQLSPEEGRDALPELVRTEKFDFAVCGDFAAAFYRKLNENEYKEDFEIKIPEELKGKKVILLNLPGGEWKSGGVKYKVSVENRILELY